MSAVHPCVRCGIKVDESAQACRDCTETDPVLLRSWRGEPVVRVAVKRKKYAARKPVVCGTESGYRKHRNAGEVACDACKAGKAQAQRDQRLIPLAG